MIWAGPNCMTFQCLLANASNTDLPTTTCEWGKLLSASIHRSSALYSCCSSRPNIVLGLTCDHGREEDTYSRLMLKCTILPLESPRSQVARR